MSSEERVIRAPLISSHLEYLQRLDPRFDPLRVPAGTVFTSAPTHLRCLDHITGIGRVGKGEDPPLAEEELRLVTEDLMTGLHGYKIGVAFRLTGRPSGTRLELGTWSRESTDPNVAAVTRRRLDLLRGILDGLYWQVERAEPTPERPDDMAGAQLSAGIVLGVPTAKPSDALDQSLPIDRLLRSLQGLRWEALVLAEPVEDDEVREIRLAVTHEMREIESVERTTQSPNPLGKHYTKILEQWLDSLTIAQSTGAWRTAVYLRGAQGGYARLSSVWRSVFAGPDSLPEPLRVWDGPQAAVFAEQWAMPDTPAQAGPGRISLPFHSQTLLTTRQLATYVHLPNTEHPGFSVVQGADFDVVPQPVQGDGVSIGRVLQRGRVTQAEYEVSTDSLASHTFVTGVTGQGKTTTVIRMLRQASTAGIKILVIEPAKTEYRSLLGVPEFEGLQLFTVGDEAVSPLRQNPLEVLPGSPVGVHIDLLRSLFIAAFGMWTPMPQILEQCLYEVYEDQGWDIARSVNRRSPGITDSRAFPTLSQLVQKVPEVTARQGFDREANDRILASLVSRLNALRTGAKGKMLDTRRSLPIDQLLDRNTVVELEAIGDDDDKAFIIGLLLTQLVEYRRSVAAGESELPRGTRHLLVIEEAHRLLPNVGRKSDAEQSDARGKAVETFANLLSEIRAYGQGVVVVDQVPTKLATDVIKNTSLKIAHRIVAGDDREVLGKAMAMSERQSDALTTLVRRQAIVLAETDDAPMLVEIPSEPRPGAPSRAAVRAHVERSGAEAGNSDMFDPTPACRGVCAPEQWHVCEFAESVLEDAAVQQNVARLLLTAMEDGGSPAALVLDLAWSVRERLGPQVDSGWTLRCVAVRGASWFADRRGAQAGWSYVQTAELEAAARGLLLRLVGRQDHVAELDRFREVACQLHRRPNPPYRRCEHICTQAPAMCLYRHAVAELVDEGSFNTYWSDARNASDVSGAGPALWDVARAAAWRLVGFPGEGEAGGRDDDGAAAAAKRAGLCFAQQMVSREAGLHPRIADDVLQSVLVAAGEVIRR